MIRAVSWNIDKRHAPWRDLAHMARRGEADVALLQEAGDPPGDLAQFDPIEDEFTWNRSLYDRWCLVVPLSDRVRVEQFRQGPPISELGERDIGVSGIGTIAVARVTPRDMPENAFIAVSMYARWMKPHPSTGPVPGRRRRRVGASDSLGPLCIYRSQGSVPAENFGRRRSEYVLRRARQRTVVARTRAHGMGADGSARSRISGAASAERSAGVIAAARRAGRYEERPDILHSEAISRGRRPPARLCFRVARFP